MKMKTEGECIIFGFKHHFYTFEINNNNNVFSFFKKKKKRKDWSLFLGRWIKRNLSNITSNNYKYQMIYLI